jgi:cyclopropane fatty-acyl-phospholipid synthase-like methyltransferase
VEILELGCGAGPFMYFAQQAGYRVRGVDASREQVAAARRLGIPGVEEGDLLQTLRSLPDESQDVVICFDVIEHFRKEELLEFSDEIWRVLRKGGKWIIHVPNGESPFFGKVFYGDFTHEQAFTRFSIKQLVLSSGYHQVVCFEDAPIPHGLKSCLRWAMWKVIRGVLRVWLTVETGTGGSDSIFSQNFVAVAEK